MSPTTSVLAAVLVVITGCRGSDSTSNATKYYWPKREIEHRAPNRLGLDSKKLESIDQLVRQRLPKTTSVLVLRHGYLAYERYFAGGPDDLRPVRSVTKSVMSILTGILLGDQWSESIDKPITTLLPDIDPHGSTTASAVTLRDVLTMRSGLQTDRAVGVHGKASIKMVFTYSIQRKPGTVFVYDNTSPNLVSQAITTRFDETAAKYAEEVLFKPLQIERYEWQEQGGLSFGGDSLSLRSRDMAKLGYLYLRKGYWRDRRVVPAGWVEESTRVQVKAGETSIQGCAYGFFWWIEDLAGYRRYFAVGSGAQTILVVPSLDMVIVMTTAETSHEEQYFSIVEDCIIPAAKVGNPQ